MPVKINVSLTSSVMDPWYDVILSCTVWYQQTIKMMLIWNAFYTIIHKYLPIIGTEPCFESTESFIERYVEYL